jgi:SM-20-related protein
MLDKIATQNVSAAASTAKSLAPGVSSIDNVFDETDRKRIFDFLSNGGWKFGWKSSAANDEFSFWHRHFAGTRSADHERDVAKVHDCADELRRGAPLLFGVWTRVRETVFAGHTLVRCYANGHTYGSDGALHTDSISDRSHTSVYYPHAAWNPNWGGETVFFNHDRTDIIASVYPKPNRLVIFRGTVPHVARGVSRTCPVLRMTLMFKTELIDG